MKTFEVTHQNAVVDAFHPDVLRAVLFNRKDAEKVAALFNDEHEKERVEPKLRKENAALKARLAKLEAILKEHNLMPHPGRKAKIHIDPVTGVATETKSEPRKKPEFKSKLCPGFEREPHLFTPNSGKQTMCTDCRTRMKASAHSARKGKSAVTTRFLYGGHGPANNPSVVRVPTVEEVLDMKDPDERSKWQSKWSDAEWAQARIVKAKKQREAWKLQREKGFRLDDPIMGVEARTSSPK